MFSADSALGGSNQRSRKMQMQMGWVQEADAGCGTSGGCGGGNRAG